METVVTFKQKEEQKKQKYKVTFNNGDEKEIEITSFGVSHDNPEIMVFFDSESEDYETPPFFILNMGSFSSIEQVKGDADE